MGGDLFDFMCRDYRFSPWASNAPLGIASMILLGIFLLYDLFTLPYQIRRIYEKAEEKVIQSLLGKENDNQSNI
jgi:hypothetical protein